MPSRILVNWVDMASRWHYMGLVAKFDPDACLRVCDMPAGLEHHQLLFRTLFCADPAPNAPSKHMPRTTTRTPLKARITPVTTQWAQTRMEQQINWPKENITRPCLSRLREPLKGVQHKRRYILVVHRQHPGNRILGLVSTVMGGGVGE